jgi:hypothetical protein
VPHRAKRCLFAFQISAASLAFGLHPMWLTHQVVYLLEDQAQSELGQIELEAKNRELRFGMIRCLNHPQ